MKKLFMLVMLLLMVCSSALAESVNDVLKDCKLETNRWKVVEWNKKEKYVRFYDSESLAVTGPGQFELITYDYFYANTCNEENCALRNSKHYHTEKNIYSTRNSKGKPLSFGKRDNDLNLVDSYEYPPSLQIPTDIERKSIGEKTMLKAKEGVKGNKLFASEGPKQEVTEEPIYGGFVPLPQPIGSRDGEWVYLGRFIGPSNYSYLENILSMKQFTGTTAHEGVMDVYYYHTHDMCSSHEFGYGYSCILKLIPLDMNGKRFQRRGFYTELVDIGGGTKGAFVGSVTKVRKYDTETHELVETLVKDSPADSRLNPLTSYGYRGSDFSEQRFSRDNPFKHAFNNSACPWMIHTNKQASGS